MTAEEWLALEVGDFIIDRGLSTMSGVEREVLSISRNSGKPQQGGNTRTCITVPNLKSSGRVTTIFSIEDAPNHSRFAMSRRRSRLDWRENMRLALDLAGVSSQQEHVEKFPGVHCWFDYRDNPSCAMCGVVRRYDGSNKPCRGVVEVALR